MDVKDLYSTRLTSPKAAATASSGPAEPVVAVVRRRAVTARGPEPAVHAGAVRSHLVCRTQEYLDVSAD